MKAWLKRTIATARFCLPLLLGACSSTPPPPQWRVDAANASERFVEAWMVGERRVEQVEFDRARERVARTGRADLVARIELLRCAARLATLVIGPCVGFVAVADALSPGMETAYADHLSGTLAPADSARIALLPPAQRAVAALPTAIGVGQVTQFEAVLAAIEDPLSRMVAAGVLLRTGRASEGVVAQAVQTASEQGWQRALLAWLTLQKQRAESRGDLAAAGRAQRRMDLITAGPRPATVAP